MNISYYINNRGQVECEVKENGKSRVTTDPETIESGLIYTSGLKYSTANRVHNRAMLVNGEFIVRISDYDEVMNTVPDKVKEDFEKRIEKTKNTVNLKKVAKIAAIGGMVLATMAGVVAMTGGVNKSSVPVAHGSVEFETPEPEKAQVYSVTHPEEVAEQPIIETVEIEDEEDIIIPEPETQNISAPVVTSDNRIYIKDVKQSGVCKDYTNYNKFFSRWTYNQRLVADIWDEKGRESDRGIATIDGRYVVAMTETFGVSGDYVDIVLDDGTVIPCILGDTKSADDSNCNAYGHDKGGKGTSVVEFETVAEADGIDISGWKNQGVKYVQLYPGLSILTPIETVEDMDSLEYSDETIEMVIEALEDELDEEIEEILSSENPEPVIIEDELIEPSEETEVEIEGSHIRH